MKKLLVVFVALLVVAFAVPAMATDITWSGDFNFGFATVVDDVKDNVGWGDLELDVAAVVDDYNTVTIETDYTADGAGTFVIGTAKIDSDLGSFFGLPVGLVFSGGWFEPGGESYAAVTGWEIEDVTQDAIGPTEAINVEVDAGMVIIDLGFSVAQGVDNWDMYLGAAVPDIAGMASAEVYFTVVDNLDWKGWFGLDGKAEVGPATVGVALSMPTMDLVDDVLTPVDESKITFKYGVGATAGLMDMLTIGVSVSGNSEDIAELIGIDVNVAATDALGLDLGTAIGLYDDARTLQCFDISGYASIGEATLRVGYNVTDTTKATEHVTKNSYKAPAILTDGKGSLYVNIGTEF